jgi:hypothetical protein
VSLSPGIPQESGTNESAYARDMIVVAAIANIAKAMNDTKTILLFVIVLVRLLLRYKF